MKKNLLFILSLLVFGISFNAQAQDISAANSVGDTIYYNITSNVAPYTVAVTYKGSSHMAYPNEYIGAIQIPSTITNNGITYSVTSIGEYAFGLCSALTSVNLPNSIRSINYQAFLVCEALTSINLDDFITSIGDFAFFGCIQLTTVNIPNTLISISHGVFKNTGLTTVNIPNSVRQIGAGAFWNCSQLVSVNIPDSVFSIGSYAFSGCSSLSSPIVLPIDLTKIENSTFDNCSSIPYVKLGKNTNSIGAYAFYNCSSLDTIIFPNNFDTIGFRAFGDCIGLTSVTFMELTPPIFESFDIFMNMPLNVQINVPCGSKALYESVLMYRNVQDSISCNFLSVNVSNISATHARINVNTSLTDITTIAYQWKENGDTSFNTYISPNFQHTITGLSPSTEYNFRIFYVINNDTTYTIIDTFLTRCSIMNLPFNEDFEGVLDCWLGFKSSADSLMIVSAGGLIPNCSPYSGVNMVKYNCWNIQAGNYAGYITPPINLLLNSQISIWLYRYNGNYSNNNEGLRFYINPENTIEGANELGFISNNRLASPIANADGWYNFILSIPNTEVGEKYIFIKAESQFGYDIYFDDLTIYSLSAVTNNINASICHGETYSLNGFNVDSAGTYIQSLNTINGGDSIVTLNLSLYPTVDTTHFTASICQGETYLLNGFNTDTAGIYTQNLQSINGCDSIIALNLSVNELIPPTNLALGNIANYIELTWRGNEENYIVYRNNDSIANVSDTIYQDTNVVDGTNYCYKIKALNSNCASELSQEVCQVFSGLNYIGNNDLSVTLYPNPTNDKATLEVEGLTKDANVIVYDINGRKVIKYKFNAGQNELEIDVNGLPKGIYNIRIVNDNATINKKLIVQ